MPDTIDYARLVRMLRSATAQIRANHELLSRLDSFGGDGDHGTTMVRAMANMEQAIEKCASPDLKTLLYDIGWAIMGTDGGATGPLFGTFFMGMSEAVAGKPELSAADLAGALESGLAAIRRQSKARAGDKTMLDALEPAVAAAREAAGGSVSDVLSRAAVAGGKGAADTAAMQARFGRAKNIGAKSIGNPDAGATSVSLIFKGFSETR